MSLTAENDALGSLSRTPSSGRAVSFPSDLDYIDHVATFRAVKRSFMDRKSSREVTDSFFTINLPMPAQLTTGYKADYGVMSGQAFGVAAENAAELRSVYDKMVGGTLIKEDATSLTSNILKSSAGAGMAAALSAAQRMPIVGEFASAATGVVGVAVNPHKAILFEGVDFRSHSFSYNLVARNETETDIIRTIIKRFKYHMSPGFAAADKLGRSFFTYPDEFMIEFRHKDYLFEIGRSVLESFNVNYHGENTPAYFRSSTATSPRPVNVQISMSFKETTITTREEIGDPETFSGGR